MSEYRPLNKCFEQCDTIRAQHLLWVDLLQERTDLHRGDIRHKIAFYMWLDKNELEAVRGKDANGDLGLGLRFVPGGN